MTWTTRTTTMTLPLDKPITLEAGDTYRAEFQPGAMEITKVSTTVYIAMINDRHSDPEPEPFTTAEAAISYARTWAQEHAHYDGDFEEISTDGWLYHASYSPESDSVWVIAKVLNVPDGDN